MSNGSGARLTSLFVQHNDRLVNHLNERLQGQWHLAEDLAQETWCEAARTLHSCRGGEREAFGWLVAIARRLVHRHFTLASSYEQQMTRSVVRQLPFVPAVEDEVLARFDEPAEPVNESAVSFGELAAPLGVAA